MKLLHRLKSTLFIILMIAFSVCTGVNVMAQKKDPASAGNSADAKKQTVTFGKASYYASKFHGKKTASGEVYRKEMLTAACNLFPLNTWIKITNLANNTSVIARINDRLHAKNKRVVDLSETAAKKLGYIADGITDVEVKVLSDYNPAAAVEVN